jgi:hypothetical protein
MSDTKRLFVKPRHPVAVFGARQGEWPEIGPEWTEVTREQLDAASAEAPRCSVQLQVLEVGSAEELLQQVQERGQAEVEVVRVAPPSQNATTEEWLHYAVEQRGLQVHEGAKRSEIQAIVAKADESPVQNEEV